MSKEEYGPRVDAEILLRDTLVMMGIARKTTWKNEETYSLLFADRAKQLMKHGMNSHAAYHWAIMKLYPDLDSDIVCVLADMWAHGGVAADSWAHRTDTLEKPPD